MVVFREVVHRLCSGMWYIDCGQGVVHRLCSGMWYIDCGQGVVHRLWSRSGT
jgi:hypothetical protein